MTMEYRKTLVSLSNYTIQSVPRIREVPKRYDSQSFLHTFSTTADFYKKLYFEIIDQTFTSLNNWFKSNTLNFLNKIGKFLLQKNNLDNDID